MQEFDNGLEKKFSFNFCEPCVSSVDVDRLKNFISKDKEAVIIFYGGEPLLQIDKIKQIMDAINVPYRMQTNGQLLHLLEPEYLNRIGKILISVDGGAAVTDKYRGKGTYGRVVKNVKLIRENGYAGELVARMTVAQDNPNVCKNVMDILETKLFDSVHWQLDVGFYKTDFDAVKISEFFEKYNTSVSRLIEFWVSEIEKGKVLLLYPFVAIASDLLLGKKNVGLRCGAGHSGYAISTSGNVQACPIMNNIEDFKAGDLTNHPCELKKFGLGECEGCSHLDLCGGRCLYWRKASLWPGEGDEMICDSIRLYIDEIRERVPRIRKAVDEGVVGLEDFEYEKFFGPEIIP